VHDATWLKEEPALVNLDVMVAYTTADAASEDKGEFGFVSVRVRRPARRVPVLLTGRENRPPVSAAGIMWRKYVLGIASPLSHETDRAAMVSHLRLHNRNGPMPVQTARGQAVNKRSAADTSSGGRDAGCSI
jgi:hypothetical protein